MRQHRGWTGLLVAALVAAVTQVGVQALDAAPAAASAGVNLSTATSASNPEAVKTAVARCPTGTRVFGGGARLFNDGGRVTLATMLPFHGSNGDGYSVAATERPGVYNEDWSVRAYAICGPELPGMEIVISATTGPQKVTFAACPAGKVVVGSGGAVGSTRQGTVLYQISPEFSSSTGYHVYVGATHSEHSDPPPDYAVFAAAVCAKKPSGYYLDDRAVFADGDQSPVVASMTCGGKLTLGAGASFSSDIAFMTNMYPNLFVVRAEARKAREAASKIWVVTVYAICAD
jgi:hypothetical protein